MSLNPEIIIENCFQQKRREILGQSELVNALQSASPNYSRSQKCVEILESLRNSNYLLIDRPKRRGQAAEVMWQLNPNRKKH